jgi:hypothetical protein
MQRAKCKEQNAKSELQRAKCKEQIAKSELQILLCIIKFPSILGKGYILESV